MAPVGPFLHLTGPPHKRPAGWPSSCVYESLHGSASRQEPDLGLRRAKSVSRRPWSIRDLFVRNVQYVGPMPGRTRRADVVAVSQTSSRYLQLWGLSERRAP